MIYWSMRKGLFLFFLLPIAMIFCEKQIITLTTDYISLSSNYVGVTEAEFHLQVYSDQVYDDLQLFRDEQLVLSTQLSIPDTFLFDTTLLPSQTYTYRALLINNDRQILKSPEVTITTMDTTNHDFQWEVYTIESPYGSGVLYDVAIIDEYNIWAVGEIYADSSQPSERYNAVYWNGQQWELKRIPYVYDGQSFYHPMNFAFSFENGEVWFGGNGIVKWNGQQYSNVEVPLSAWGYVAINKGWGSSNLDVYIVGNEGHIAHYNGSSWQKRDSGTDLPIQVSWGETD